MNYVNRFLFYLIFSCSLIYSCKEETKKTEPLITIVKKEAIPVDTITPKQEVKKDTVTIPPIHYSIYSTKEITDADILKNYKNDSLEVLMALNRVDEDHFHKLDSVIIPDHFDSLLSYSPLPFEIKNIDTVPKMILVSYRFQAIGLYEKGKLIRWAPASTGKKTTPTPTGLFYTNWKAKTTVSTENPEWILNWYFNLDNKRGVSLHQYELPGYPASHACVRLREKDAHFIYYWAEQFKLNDSDKVIANGTPVLIFGEYPFGKRRPWRAICNSPDSVKINESQMGVLIEKYYPVSLTTKL